jgi:hypothetical protein
MVKTAEDGPSELVVAAGGGCGGEELVEIVPPCIISIIFWSGEFLPAMSAVDNNRAIFAPSDVPLISRSLIGKKTSSNVSKMTIE